MMRTRLFPQARTPPPDDVFIMAERIRLFDENLHTHRSIPHTAACFSQAQDETPIH